MKINKLQLKQIIREAIAEGDLVGVLLLEGGTIASAVAGVALIIVSHGLARRVSSAWWFAISALLAGAVASLLNDFGFENAAFLGTGALLLLPFRQAFDRPGRLTAGVFDVRWFATVVGVGMAAAAFFFFVHKAVPYSLVRVLAQLEHASRSQSGAGGNGDTVHFRGLSSDTPDPKKAARGC